MKNMLEEYLKESTYNYKIHATFENYGNPHVVATESDSGGIDSNYFIIFQGNNQIFNVNGDLCANIVDGKIVIVEY